jgi:ABC-type branched-subunit amino acid transport system substrate-binding protein/cytochrome c553
VSLLIRRLGRLVLLLGLAAWALPAASAGLTAEEEIGKKIYFEGISPSGVPIQALVGATSTPVSGETLTCSTCHGADGLGRPEGSVKPSNITWQELTKSYGHRHENGREHGPFDERSFADVLTYGKDPAGNRLDSTMPRYIMSNKDVAALTAYIKRMAADLDPGLTADALRIGTLVPASGRMAEVGKAALGVMKGYADTLNAQGGIFGRRIELVAADLPEDPAAASAAAERLAKEGGVFALVSPFSVGSEKSMAELAESAKLPVIGPFTLSPDTTLAVNRYTFYLLPGLNEQGRALADFAAKELKLTNPIAAVVHPETAGDKEAAAAVEEQLQTRNWSRIVRASYPPGKLQAAKLVADLQQRGVQVIFFLGGDADLGEFGKQVRDAIWTPYLLAPGARAGRAAVDLPTTFGNRVFLAYPTLPRDITPKAAGTLSELEKKGGFGARHQPAQVSALAAMLVLEEALKRAGRDLSRAKLVNALENLFSFETGVMPGISYGPTRRIGALGAHIVAVDLSARQFRPTGHYMRLD